MTASLQTLTSLCDNKEVSKGGCCADVCRSLQLSPVTRPSARSVCSTRFAVTARREEGTDSAAGSGHQSAVVVGATIRRRRTAPSGRRVSGTGQRLSLTHPVQHSKIRPEGAGHWTCAAVALDATTFDGPIEVLVRRGLRRLSFTLAIPEKREKASSKEATTWRVSGTRVRGTVRLKG